LSRDWLLILSPGLIWGASFLFIAEALRALGPNGITFGRIAIGFATLAMFPSARGEVGRGDWGKIALLGVIWFAFPLSLFPYAEQRVSSALTGMLNGANPMFATLVASLMAQRWPSGGVLMGLAVGLLGTVLTALPALHEGSSSAAGVAMILVAVFCYGISVNVARPLQMKYGGPPVIWRAQAVGLLLTAPLGLPELLEVRWQLWPLLSRAALGAMGTGLAYILLATSAGRFGAIRASSTTFVIPVVALALGVVLRDEQVAGISVVGGLVCLVGAWLMKRAAEFR
jgi:drug/metabolite transporter (DMT)-like permease